MERTVHMSGKSVTAQYLSNHEILGESEAAVG